MYANTALPQTCVTARDLTNLINFQYEFMNFVFKISIKGSGGNNVINSSHNLGRVLFLMCFLLRLSTIRMSVYNE